MISQDLSAQRISELQKMMVEHDVDLVAIGPTPNMQYLLGFVPFPDERACVLLISRENKQIVIPGLNANQFEAEIDMKGIRWTDAAGPRLAMQEALDSLDIQPGVVMAADDTMRADVFLLLQDMAKPRASIAAESLMLSLRLKKSEIEVQALSLAAAQADEALLVGVDACCSGVTEREVADKIANYFRSHGAEVVDFTLVASGPNGAYPHHQFSDRILQVGDFVILDIGATLNGYHSDVTRMVHLGEPSEEERAILNIVLEANKQGREAIKPGARACDIDHATRSVIEKAGYGPNFFHRTGHGIGLEVHETPWITPTNETILEPGMAFSVEPGIYLPGRLGVRIEDIVIVTKEGYHCLTGVNQELFVKS